MYILMTKHGCTTARALRRLLGCGGGYYSHLLRKRDVNTVVNWGNGQCPEAERVLNSGNAVVNAADKLASLRLLQEAGINVPRFSTNPADFGDGTFLGRKRTHFGGRDITVFDGMHTQAVFSDYFTEFVPSDREMRLHIFRGELIGAQNKRYEGADELTGIPIRNHDRGWVFVPLLNSRPHQTRIDTAMAAVEALGLDFGAVDLLCTAGGGSTVLEVNTAPGLSERFQQVYADAIRRWESDGS